MMFYDLLLLLCMIVIKLNHPEVIKKKKNQYFYIVCPHRGRFPNDAMVIRSVLPLTSLINTGERPAYGSG